MRGPYIVTSGQPFRYEDANVGGIQVESRHAVATLDDAKRAAHNVVIEHMGGAHAGYGIDCYRLPGSGGTVGPLPDETVITVERVEWQSLWEQSGWSRPTLGPPDARERREIIDAWNAEYAVPAVG
jgi:hypothetical protein